MEQCFWNIDGKCTALNNPPWDCIGCFYRESLEEFCDKLNIKPSVTESDDPSCVRLTVSGKRKTLTKDVPKDQDERMHFVDMIRTYFEMDTKY